MYYLATFSTRRFCCTKLKIQVSNAPELLRVPYVNQGDHGHSPQEASSIWLLAVYYQPWLCLLRAWVMSISDYSVKPTGDSRHAHSLIPTHAALHLSISQAPAVNLILSFVTRGIKKKHKYMLTFTHHVVFKEILYSSPQSLWQFFKTTACATEKFLIQFLKFFYELPDPCIFVMTRKRLGNVGYTVMNYRTPPSSTSLGGYVKHQKQPPTEKQVK